MAIANQTKIAAAGVVPSHALVAFRMSFDGDDAYATGGTANFSTVVHEAIEHKAPLTILGVVPENCGAYLPQYDKVADKLLVRQLSDGAEVAAAADLSGTSFTILVIGY